MNIKLTNYMYDHQEGRVVAGNPQLLNFNELQTVQTEMQSNMRVILTPTSEDGVDLLMDVKPKKDYGNRLNEAYNSLMIRLFGEIPENVQAESIHRSTYDESMEQVQKLYSIEQGDPDFLEWVLTLIGRSPKIVDDEPTEGAGTDESGE